MKKVKTIGCEEALKHLLTYLDQELGATRSREVEHHLSLCRSCFSRAEFEKRLQSRLAEVGKEEVRPSFETRIRKLIDTF
ncbi:MAG: zf-HC2 domain-containing protein [Nitrospirae bacterium]|nr:zf-HC2 domain-containing protein [Nitrospirota bacterium]